MFFTEFVWVMENLESCEKLYYVWHVNYCRCGSKDNIKYSYARKYSKTKMILTIFKSGSQTLGHGKLENVMGKVVESHGI